MAISPTEIRDWTIYRITSPSGRVYIGKTVSYNKRLQHYKHSLCKPQKLLYASLLKYGYSNHTADIIDKFNGGNDTASGKEMFWIRSFMSNKNRFPEQNGLNLTDGGDGSAGKPTSEETKEKLRKANVGKKQSEETKLKKSISLRGVKKDLSYITPEFRKRVSDQKTGYKHTEETKSKISKYQKGKKHWWKTKQSPEEVEKARQRALGNKYAVGYKPSLEVTNKRTEKIRGLKRSPEQKERYKEAQIKSKGKPVAIFNLQGNLVGEYRTRREAAIEFGIDESTLLRKINLGSKNIFCKNSCYKDYIFKYK